VERKRGVFKCLTCGLETEDLLVAVQHALAAINHKVVITIEN